MSTSSVLCVAGLLRHSVIHSASVFCRIMAMITNCSTAVLIPHDAVDESKTLDGLAGTFTYRRPEALGSVLCYGEYPTWAEVQARLNSLRGKL